MDREHRLVDSGPLDHSARGRQRAGVLDRRREPCAVNAKFQHQREGPHLSEQSLIGNAGWTGQRHVPDSATLPTG